MRTDGRTDRRDEAESRLSAILRACLRNSITPIQQLYHVGSMTKERTGREGGGGGKETEQIS